MGSLSNRVRRARRHAELSQSQLGELLGVTRSAVAHWERAGGSNASTQNLCGIVSVTGVNFEWLAAGRGNMRPQVSSAPTTLGSSIYLARDDAEEHLLIAFRSLRPSARNNLLSLIEEMFARRAPIRQ